MSHLTSKASCSSGLIVNTLVVVFPDLYKSSQVFAAETNEQFFYYCIYLKAIKIIHAQHFESIFLYRNNLM